MKNEEPEQNASIQPHELIQELNNRVNYHLEVALANGFQEEDVFEALLDEIAQAIAYLSIGYTSLRQFEERVKDVSQNT